MGRKRRNTVSDLGVEGNSTSAAPTTEQTDTTKEIGTAINKENLTEVDIALDISTSVTGVVALHHITGDVVKFDFIKLNTVKLTNIYEKADFAKQWLIDNMSDVKVKRIFVEANAKMFAAGFSSADVLLTLAKMNALLSYLAHKQFNAPIIEVHVTSARTQIGYKNSLKDKRSVKEKVREFVLKNNSKLPIRQHIAKTGKFKGQLVMDTEMSDCIDAYVIALGGRALHKIT